MKAHPELYKGEDINAYYQEFKALNSLEGRKLKLGEELMFPHTAKSKELADAEAVKEQKKKARAERKLRQEAAALNAEPAESSDSELSLFGSDTRSSAASQARAKAQRENARYNTMYHFQRTLLPLWLCDPGNPIGAHIENGNIDALREKSFEQVDQQFSDALVLHPYPDKGIYVLEFEEPKKMEGLFFLAIKREESGKTYIYALERGLSVFGAGDASIFSKYKSDGEFSDLGGRQYMDLTSFLQEIETIR